MLTEFKNVLQTDDKPIDKKNKMINYVYLKPKIYIFYIYNLYIKAKNYSKKIKFIFYAIRNEKKK